MKRFYRIISAVLCVALLIPVLATTVFAVSPELEEQTLSAPTGLENSFVSFDVGENGVYKVANDSSIKLNFSIPLDQEEVEKVTVASLTTGKLLTGKWQGADQSWQFIPYDIQEGAHYTIVVPEGIFDRNGEHPISEAVTYSFSTNSGLAYPAYTVGTVVRNYPCTDGALTHRPAIEQVGHTLNNSYKLVNITRGQDNIVGLQLDLRNLAGFNVNQNANTANVRMYPFQEIWSGAYVGQVVRFSFTAKASVAGDIALTLNQLHVTADGSANDYTNKNFPGLDERAHLTTEWQTYTFEFTVTYEMYDQIQYGRLTNASPNLALGLRFPGFAEGSGYNGAQITIRDIIVTVGDSEANLDGTEPFFATFEDKKYPAEKLNLRFAVENDAVGTVGIYEATNGILGAKLGSVAVNGAGMYTLDTDNITSYFKNYDGAPVIAFKAVGANGPIDLVATSPMLTMTVSEKEDLLPTVSSSVLASNPNGTPSGLYISGGKDGFDTQSVKSYLKLSLADYTGGYAGFVFNAISEGEGYISVYGVADVTKGESWDPSTITTTNAPANDVYGAGVNLNDVYGNGSLATFKVNTYENTYRVHLTEFAQYMKQQGADEVTLIIVTSSNYVTSIKLPGDESSLIIDEFDCETKRPELRQAGFNNAAYLAPTDTTAQIDLSKITTSSENTNANVRIYVLGEIWKDRSYINKTVRVTFYARSTSGSGTINLALQQLHVTADGSANDYTFKKFPGLDTNVSIDTSWKQVSCDFVVTEAMFNQLQYGRTGGINIPDIALGVRFNSFSNGGAYNSTQLQFRNFVVSEAPVEETVLKIASWDCINAGVDADASGYTGLSIGHGTKQGFHIDTTNAAPGGTTMPNSVVYLNIFKNVWSDPSYVGKNIRFSFAAKASKEGSIDLTFNQKGSNGASNFTNYTNFSKTANLTTSFQTFTFEFTVTQEMYDLVNNGTITKGLALGVRFTDFSDGTNYDDVQILFKDFVISNVIYSYAANQVEGGDATAYSSSFTDVKYDFSTNTGAGAYGYPVLGYSNGAAVIDLSKATNRNENQNVRLEVLSSVFNNANVGKTFSVKIRIKASEAGLMDATLNAGTTNGTYSYSNDVYRTYYKSQYYLTTSYQTITYSFVLTSNMVSTNSSSPMNLALRFTNGYAEGDKYKNAQIYIDEVTVYEETYAGRTTVEITDTKATGGYDSSDSLRVFDAKSDLTPEIYKTYLSYDLTDITAITKAHLNLTLSGASGETVRMYVLTGADIPAGLTYSNAPVPKGTATLTFTAANGVNTLDLTALFQANEGGKLVLVFTIEHMSERVEITGVNFDVTVDRHNPQKYEATDPSYNAPGTEEFYYCECCANLYVSTSTGPSTTTTTIDDVILPPVEYTTKFSGASLNIGKDLTVRYHVELSKGESVDGYSIRFTLRGKTVTVTESDYDYKTGKYIFSFRGIAPQLMGDEILAELLNNGRVIEEKTYSVREYVEKALVTYPDDAKLKQLLADLLAYGAAAQQYIGYKTDSLVTDAVDNLPATSTATPDATDNKKQVTESTNSSVHFTAAGVRFDYNNRIYVKFTAPTLDGVTVSVNGVNLEIEETDKANVYIAYSDAISALDFAKEVTFKLSYGGAEVQSLVYTVNSYAYTKNSDTPIGRLALALYRYGKSALEYATSN